ncbi:hypothetical protein HDU97_009054 [Phlyctochytrium planicorne]|nr:hypothetical protein HDU97_009054 [Phlyctochytrium planicorne]
MAIPDLFLTPSYESQLGAFWVEALSNGKLEDLKIVLSAPEKDKSVGPKPFDYPPQFINALIFMKPMRKGKKLADSLKSIHIEGNFFATDSNFYPKHVKFFSKTDLVRKTFLITSFPLDFFKNLTTLRLTNINLGVQVFQYDRRLRTDIGQIICPNLVDLHLIGCRLPFRSIESRGGSIIGYDAQSLLCYLSNSFGIKLRCLILDHCVVDDYDEQAASISLFIDKHLPEKLQGGVNDTGKTRKRGATIDSSTPEDDGWFVNCHNMLPDKMYFLTVYWAESKRETLKGPFTLLGY